MRKFMRPLLFYTLLALSLSGCTPVGQFLETLVTVSQRVNERMVVKEPPLPARPLYGLASPKPVVNDLAVIDLDTWEVVRRAPLLSDFPTTFSRDPLGRIWVGFLYNKFSMPRVQIFAPNGRLLHTLPTCYSALTSIHFAADQAFIACEKPGLRLAVNVVDLTSVQIVHQIDIPLEGKSFSLTASGGDENYFILVGAGDPNNWAVLVDTHTLQPLPPLSFPVANARTVLAHQGRFYLLNSVAELSLRQGWVEALPAGRPDLIVIDPNPTPTVTIREMIAPGALWGLIKGDTLYAYHDAQRVSLLDDPYRAISRLNLLTNEAELWPLPDNWNARDIALVDDEILLAWSSSLEKEKSGLYRFDPTSGELTLLVHLPGIQRLLSPLE